MLILLASLLIATFVPVTAEEAEVGAGGRRL